MSYRYVAMGDSSAEGVGDLPNPDGTARGWTDRLAAILTLEHRELEYANLAVRGLKAQQILDSQLPAARRLRPDLVTISAGVNDLLRPNFTAVGLETTLKALVSPLASDGVSVALVPAPPIAHLMPLCRMADTIDRRIAIMNDVLDTVARDHAAIVPGDLPVDLFGDSRLWAPDRLHLNHVGHDRLAHGIAAALGLDTGHTWKQPLVGPHAPRTVRSDAQWWISFATPWLIRRARGKSSADGRVAKRPNLEPVE